jgi:membrane-bound lytic murein transglycosylase D
MVGLYNRWCTQGKRADLAHTLVMSDASNAIVRTGPLTVLPSSDGAVDGTQPTTIAAGELAGLASPQAPAKKKPATPRDYRVQRGETLTDVAQKFQCDTKQLAKANGIKAPRYMVKPGQKLKLNGCGP